MMDSKRNSGWWSMYLDTTKCAIRPAVAMLLSMTAAGTAAWMRVESHHRDKVILLTNSATHEHRSRCAAFGASAVFDKTAELPVFVQHCERFRREDGPDGPAGQYRLAVGPGDSLDEDALASCFGVSRTPVREALLHLSVLGIVTIAPRSGIYVSRLSMPEVLALTEMLAELEASCAKLATRRIGSDEANRLKRIHQESLVFEKNGDAQGYARCNAQFHEVLYQACRNSPLAAEIARIRARTRIYRQSVFQNQLRIRKSREDHTKLINAVLAGDATAASEAMLEHIAGGMRELADMIAHVPTQMLAVDADYPGRRGR